MFGTTQRRRVNTTERSARYLKAAPARTRAARLHCAGTRVHLESFLRADLGGSNGVAFEDGPGASRSVTWFACERDDDRNAVVPTHRCPSEKVVFAVAFTEATEQLHRCDRTER